MKIAPTLRKAHPHPLTGEAMQGARQPIVTYRADDAYRELAALLAVARLADRHTNPHEKCPACDPKMRAAVERLWRVSGRAKGGTT